MCHCIWSFLLLREVKWFAQGDTAGKDQVQDSKPRLLDSNTYAALPLWHGQCHSPSIRTDKLWWCLNLHLICCHGHGQMRGRCNFRGCLCLTSPWPHPELMAFSAKSMNAITALEWLYLRFIVTASQLFLKAFGGWLHAGPSICPASNGPEPCSLGSLPISSWKGGESDKSLPLS